MLCAACHHPIEDGATSCPRCHNTPLVDGRYALLAPLGHGARGTTWRARRLVDGLEVALKYLPIHQVERFSVVDRLTREARLLAALDHPNIPKLLEHLITHTPQPAAVLVTQLVDGEDWSSTQHHLTVAQALTRVAGVLDILAYLHRAAPPLVHRDLSPGNIIQRHDGAVFLVDFHSAAHAAAPADSVHTTSLGTPGFMAPEQLLGVAIPATDIYSAGCVLLWLLGRVPLQAMLDDGHRLDWRAHVQAPSPVKRVLGQMLDPNPSKRPQDAAALARTLRALATGNHRRPAASVAVMVAATLALGTGGVFATAALQRKTVAPPAVAAATTPSVAGSSTGTPFPDVPGSVCQAQGNCIALEDSALVQATAHACATSAKEMVPPRVAGMTPFCQLRVLGGMCLASCTLRFHDVDLRAYQQRAEDVAQSIRDVHGRENSVTPWRTLTSTTRQWSWQAVNTQVTLKANHRDLPPGSPVPTDLHLEVQLRLQSTPRPAL